MLIRAIAMSTLALCLAFAQTLESPYTKWLAEDVAYILSNEERQAFARLSTDDERENFIEQFWLRRDPTPDTAENEFKEEHYRRISYANERYASGSPGWRTDRGRIYITFGPPDEIESHPSGGTYQRPIEEGGGVTSVFPFEKWRYRYIDGVGSDVDIEFVDRSMTGEYRMTLDPSETDALLMVHGASPMGAASMNQLERLEQSIKLMRPPVRFKELEAQVNSTILFNVLPMRARADFFPLTGSSVLTSITVSFENKDLKFQLTDGVETAVVNLYGRVTTLSRRVASVFEDVITVEAPNSALYQRSVSLAPGLYRLNIVVKDTIGGNSNNYEMTLNVPRFDPGKMTTSSLILADQIDNKVLPRVSATFHREETLGIYLKVYNVTPGFVEYEIVRNGVSVLRLVEDSADPGDRSGQQVTLSKLIPLANLLPGPYSVTVHITDRNTGQSLTREASFIVN